MNASDVSAVVLTLGEPTTDAAIAALARQTLAPREVIVVRDVRPVHAALNAGVAKVKTPFFIQVDADMILDPGCIATLRAAVRRDTGIVVGHLRDALIRDTVGVKLFRTDCFRIAKFPDRISPDTEFGRAIAAAGWQTVWINNRRLERWKTIATFGEHGPSYTPRYTYSKYLLEGRRYRSRRDIGGMRWHFRRLEVSLHPAAMIATIALARGIFLDAERDLAGILQVDEDFHAIDSFLQDSANTSAAHDIPALLDKPGAELFSFFYRTGRELFLARDLLVFARLMGSLGSANVAQWVAKVGLCRGLLAQHSDRATIEADYRVLAELIEQLTLRAKFTWTLREVLAERSVGSRST